MTKICNEIFSYYNSNFDAILYFPRSRSLATFRTVRRKIHQRKFCDVLALSQTSPLFSHVCSTSLLKTLWEKEKLLVTSNFSFSPVFSTLLQNFIFIKFKIVVCNPLSDWKSVKSVVWEKLNLTYTIAQTLPVGLARVDAEDVCPFFVLYA